MNKLICILILILSTSSFSQKLKTGFNIISDSIKLDVANDSCLVFGTVKDINGSIINKGSIVTIGYKKRSSVNLDGSFSVVISELDSVLYFVSSYHTEVPVKYAFKKQHKVEVEIITEHQIMEVVPLKPIIYLYSENEKDVSIQLTCKKGFSFCYPTYKNGWNAKTSKNGDLLIDEKTYPYIFWEGNQHEITYARNNTTQQLIGFNIKTDSVISFLENKLAILGLNDRESTDFITFWGPKITKTPYAFVQFMEHDEYDKKVASISVSPKPESIQRIFMVFEGFDSIHKCPEIIPQTLTSFKRKGYTLIEWGGSEINKSQLTQ